MENTSSTAIVVGASFAGLCAARVLADHFERVILVEKDDLADDFAARKGAPHGRHTHALLARGSDLLEKFFPGLRQEAADAGAVPIELGRDVLWFNHGVFLREKPTGEFGYSLSRPRLEGLIRQRLRARNAVQILDRTEAVHPVFDRAQGRVVGLNIQPRGGAATTLEAALVVDAGGRGARAPAWLDEMGYARAPEEQVRVDIAYTTCLFRRRPEQLSGHTAIVMGMCAPDWRGGAMVAQEGETWIATLGGYFGDGAPLDVAGFLEFARGLQKPDFYEALRDAEPLSEPFLYRIPSSLRRRYERLKRFPEGFLAFGDALCSFNPIYGQGMTVATAEAEALAQCLAAGRDQLAPRFFRAAAGAIDIPWDMAVGSDLLNPRVEGPRSARTRFVNWWVKNVFLAGGRDPALAAKFIRVANLTLAPFALLDFDSMRRVARFRLGGAPAAG